MSKNEFPTAHEDPPKEDNADKADLDKPFGDDFPWENDPASDHLDDLI